MVANNPQNTRENEPRDRGHLGQSHSNQPGQELSSPPHLTVIRRRFTHYNRIERRYNIFQRMKRGNESGVSKRAKSIQPRL